MEDILCSLITGSLQLQTNGRPDDISKYSGPIVLVVEINDEFEFVRSFTSFLISATTLSLLR
jgi:hypothetical protein